MMRNVNKKPAAVPPDHASQALQPLPDTARPSSNQPVTVNYDCSHLTIGAGVAIFHIATSRVVLCRHSVDNYWFLPKGRRDAGEDTGAGAEREGFEESGYRNRLLPIPMRHRQPQPCNPLSNASSPFATEPIWTQLIPLTSSSQYMLFWYIAETLPPEMEKELNAKTRTEATATSPTPYQYPPKYPATLTLEERLEMEVGGYEPVHHLNTAVDSEEALYESHLLPVEEAVQKLKGTIQEYVVRSGWQAIVRRHQTESKA
ncbi:NUDIX hydrolase, conserved site [Lasallia pustulata]|uniref:NUDIX hydrolase, conserved site n=1 Tax=Lasallia pustulata TaxID=136370 RepID=A0A1W5D2S0_9LECA|nr:NUDIX hydrolase, conserved site [Lasallia pustulata]